MRRLLSSHDDFWTSTKSEAESTPAYDNATRAAPNAAAPTPGGDEAGLAIPGVVGSMPQQMQGGVGSMPQQQMPSGKAYGYQREGPRMARFTAPPAFDMQSPMHLSPVRQIDVRSFKGTTLVDIRQYYKTEDGTVVPTKKGISLTVAQWKLLKGAMDDVDRVIAGQESMSDDIAYGNNVDVLDGSDGRR